MLFENGPQCIGGKKKKNSIAPSQHAKSSQADLGRNCSLLVNFLHAKGQFHCRFFETINLLGPEIRDDLFRLMHYGDESSLLLPEHGSLMLHCSDRTGYFDRLLHHEIDLFHQRVVNMGKYFPQKGKVRENKP